MTQISLTFPDGSARKYNAGITPAVIANSISKSLSKKAVSATVNGQHWDLAWPIKTDAQFAIHTMADEEQAQRNPYHRKTPPPLLLMPWSHRRRTVSAGFARARRHC